MSSGSWSRSVFRVPGMDCPSEEQMIKTALADVDPLGPLEFDLAERRLVVVHGVEADTVLARLAPLGLGAKLESTAPTEAPTDRGDDEAERARERSVLRALLAINAFMFVTEMAAGWWAQSTGLMADALDMLADAAVYGLSLYAVGRAARLQVRAAHVSGWLQMALALGALSEVVRRFVTGSEPEPLWMTVVATVALAANVACLWLISAHRGGGAHMKASWIFSTNDVLANLGVIVAGGLVHWTGTRYPDLVIGTVIAAVVLTGAVRILRLR